MKRNSSLFALIFLLAACTATPDQGYFSWIESQDASVNHVSWLHQSVARTVQEGMTADVKQIPDVPRYGAKVAVGGEAFAISSDAPVIIDSAGYGADAAVSVLRIEPGRREVLLLTRNPENGEAFRAIITFDKGFSPFAFPILRGGMLQTENVQLLEWAELPPAEDNMSDWRAALKRAVPYEQPRYVYGGRQGSPVSTIVTNDNDYR